MSEFYEPAEDSYLLRDVLKKEIPKILKKNSNLIFLEIGSGSGIQLQTAKEIGVKNIFSCDINQKAVEHCRLSRGFNCVKSDLFEAFKGRLNVKGTLVPLQFDLIIFNPPYLPIDENEPVNSRLETTGGKYGGELINKFLIQAKNHLKKNGKIFLLISNLTKGINFNGYKKKIIAKKKLFFEELYVLELSI